VKIFVLKIISLLLSLSLLLTLNACSQKIKRDVNINKISTATSNDNHVTETTQYDNRSNNLEKASVVYDHCQVDINNDKLAEDISLLKNNDNILILKVGEKSINLYNLENSLPFSEDPKIHIVNEQASDSKDIMITAVWTVADSIGTVVQAWIYNAEREKLNKIFDINNDWNIIKYNLTMNKSGKYTIAIPDIHIEKEIEINSANDNLITKQDTFEISNPVTYWNRQSQWRPKSIPTILKTGAKKLVPVFSIAMVFGCR